MNKAANYVAFLSWERNKCIQLKEQLYKEAEQWKRDKYGGRADVCYEMYAKLRDDLKKSLAEFKTAVKGAGCRVLYRADYFIEGIEQRTKEGFITIAKNSTEIERIGQDYVVEGIILGEPGAEP